MTHMMSTLGEKPETAGSDDVSGGGGGGQGDEETCRYDRMFVTVRQIFSKDLIVLQHQNNKNASFSPLFKG